MGKLIELFRDFKDALKEGFNEVKLYRKTVKEITEAEYNGLYDNPLYTKEETGIKEQLKHDIHIYRMAHLKYGLSKFKLSNLVPYSLWKYSTYGWRYVYNSDDNNKVNIILKKIYLRYINKELNSTKYFNSLLYNSDQEPLKVSRDNLILILIDFKVLAKLGDFNIVENYAKIYNSLNIDKETRIELEELLGIRNFTIRGKFVVDNIKKHAIIDKPLLDIKRFYARDDFDILVGNDIYRNTKIEIYDILP